MQKVAPAIIGTLLAQTARCYGLYEVPESDLAIYKRFRIEGDPTMFDEGAILIHDFKAEAYEKAL